MNGQSRLDAVADAETLRVYGWRDHETIPDGLGELSLYAVWGRSPRPGAPTAQLARLAAHEAFRVCPGLR